MQGHTEQSSREEERNSTERKFWSSAGDPARGALAGDHIAHVVKRKPPNARERTTDKEEEAQSSDHTGLEVVHRVVTA